MLPLLSLGSAVLPSGRVESKQHLHLFTEKPTQALDFLICKIDYDPNSNFSINFMDSLRSLPFLIVLSFQNFGRRHRRRLID